MRPNSEIELYHAASRRKTCTLATDSYRGTRVKVKMTADEKIRANAAKYPVDLAKGNATKYTDFGK